MPAWQPTTAAVAGQNKELLQEYSNLDCARFACAHGPLWTHYSLGKSSHENPNVHATRIRGFDPEGSPRS
ncbi:hypothetical protein DF3PB_10043 [uncultured Defluviicoccus sp.]|uniref:Uncharacterized protein n=1 Tax=metagenome TaxID=256318 RepID=A0A380T8H4_9ZZZZ|nr:hypothetical protein DF3PB_10043 [uncultured Defluviicoccus sp.]